MADVGKIFDGMNHCVPANADYANLGCGLCPYCESCAKNGDRSLAIVFEIVDDMRKLCEELPKKGVKIERV